MLQAFHLSYEYAPLFGPLFTDLNLALNAGEKVALVGPNGCGKSTLLRILAGELQPNEGRVVLPGGHAAVYMPQDFDWDFDGTAEDAMVCADPRLATLWPLVKAADPDAEAQWDTEDGPAARARMDRALAMLGLPRDMLGHAWSTLSLGERMRVKLASLMGRDPEVLLLDEPTNHLDIAAREWLESFLLKTRQTVLTVCHDRAMLDAVVTRVVELEYGILTSYSGNYSAMLEAKSARLASEMEAWERGRDEVRRLKNAAEKLAQNAEAVAGRSTSRTYDPKAKPFFLAKAKRVDQRAKAVRSRVRKMQVEGPTKPFVADVPKLAFRAQALHSSDAVWVHQVSKSYDGKAVLDGVSFTLERGSKAALIGPNGCGKTTLFRVIIREETPDAGEVRLGSGARIGYLSQARLMLDLSKTVIANIDPVDSNAETFARSLLGRLGLRGDAPTKIVGELSVGERTKVELVKILLSPCNVLLLDEPTNHLDIQSMEALEEALREFPGSVLFATHDRAFAAALADMVVDLGS
jgi:ATPase subunit of ABC transporter with duplicated ATPase domains